MKNNYYPVSFRLEKPLVDRLKKEAEKERRSMTNMLEWIIYDYFKRIEEGEETK